MKACCIRSLGGLFLLAGWLAGPALLNAQPAFRFTTVQPLTNRELRLKLDATNGFFYRIDATTNLPDWSALVTLAGVKTGLQLTDSAAPYLPQRLYRAQLFTETNTFTGDHLTSTNGDVIIHPINHATFVLRWNGKTIYNDPVDPATRYTGLPKADLILVSHDHTDHFNSSTIDAVRASNAVIIVPSAVYSSLSAAQKLIAIVLTNSATTNVLGLTVEAIPAYNTNVTGTIYHPKGRGNGYVLNVGGRRIYASGDTDNIPEMRALPDIDVAFVCMVMPYTMPVDRAASAVREFRPRVVYPYHFFSNGSPTSDVNDFKRRVGQDLGIEVRLRQWY